MSSRLAVSTLDETCAGLFPKIPDREGRSVLRGQDSGRWLTADELRYTVLLLAGHISAPRKRLVFLLATNTASTVIGLLAAAAAGHAVALIDPLLARDKLTQLVETYQPEIILTSGSLEYLVQPNDRPVRWRIASGNSLSPNIAFRTESGTVPEIAADLLLLLSTSGTTGSSKFVRLSRSAILANAAQIANSLDVDTSSVGIAHLPLHYSYGLSVVTSHLLIGASVNIIEDTITSPTFWEKVAESAGTHFPGVPFHYAVLARLGFSFVPDTVTTFTQAGGAIDQRILTRIVDCVGERHGRLYVMYGQTEASPRMTTLPYVQVAQKTGSVGTALSGGRVTILGADGTALSAGQIGSVVYEGPNVMMGYAENRMDLSLGDQLRGRLETGDLGKLDHDGYLFLSGRTKRFAKIAGLRLSLDEIEAEISKLGCVACIDVGEKILVFFEGEIEDALKSHMKKMAAEYKIPATSFARRSIAFMPRKASGKIDYTQLKEMTSNV